MSARRSSIWSSRASAAQHAAPPVKASPTIKATAILTGILLSVARQYRKRWRDVQTAFDPADCPGQNGARLCATKPRISQMARMDADNDPRRSATSAVEFLVGIVPPPPIGTP